MCAPLSASPGFEFVTITSSFIECTLELLLSISLEKAERCLVFMFCVLIDNLALVR